MTHDPLCPVGVKPWEDSYCCQTCNPGEIPAWQRTCHCDELAKARADERQQALNAARQAVNALQVAIYSYYPDDSMRDVGFWRSSALAAIDALREKP